MRTLSILFALALALPLAAQTPSEQAARSDAILTTLRKVELVNQLLPMLLNKEQMSKVLTAVERARAEARKTEKDEYEFLRRLEPKLEAALKDALEKGVVPKQELFTEVAATLQTLQLKRKAVADDNTEKVAAVLEEVLDAGQKKAVANSLNVRLFMPNADPDKVTDEEKMRLFVKYILLDPQAYDLLLKMPKKE